MEPTLSSLAADLDDLIRGWEAITVSDKADRLVVAVVKLGHKLVDVEAELVELIGKTQPDA